MARLWPHLVKKVPVFVNGGRETGFFLIEWNQLFQSHPFRFPFRIHPSESAMSTASVEMTHTTTPVAPTVLPAGTRADERAAAAVRRAAYPYRFPRDNRRLGGAFTVEQNATRLLRFFYLERRLAQGLGSWTLSIPDFEVKVETGRHIFWHMDAARTLRARLNEQERRLNQIDDFRDAEIDGFIDELLSATDTPELLIGAHQVLGAALATAYRHHIDHTCPVADAPTIRALKQILLDYTDMLAWADAAIAVYVAGGIDESRLEAWRFHLGRLLQSIGGVTGAEARTPRPRALRSDPATGGKPYVRGTVPTRDSRFVTFTNGGDHNVVDGTPRFPVGSYELERLQFIRAQRDEVDAIEAFGTCLWDIRFQGFDAELALAHITWDESRHTEIGQRAMLASGYDPFELPNRMTSSFCRGPMEATYAFAEINLFGEVGVMKNIPKILAGAETAGDQLITHIADFIRSDERTHVRAGQKIIKTMTDLDMPALELKTRQAFTGCLVTLGAIPANTNPEWAVSRADIERLVGE